MALRTISHAELNAKINAQSYKKYKESDRNQIKRANHCETDSGSNRKSDHQAEGYRQNQLPGAQRQPQDDQHSQYCKGGVSECALPDYRELIIIHRHRAGQRDFCAVSVAKLEVG